MADDDIVHLIDDPGDEPPPRGRAALEGRGDRRRAGGARRHPFRAQRLQAQRPRARNPLGLFGRRGPRAHAQASRRRGGAARRDHGDRRRRPGARRVHPQRAQERDRAHHPAHRPARPGAGAARHRRLRHQRLQGEDRAHRRQAVHRADRGVAQPSAASAHGRDPPRARDHHRGGLDACSISSRCSGWPKAC